MAELFFEISISLPETYAGREQLIPLLESMGCHGFLEEEEALKGYLMASNTTLRNPEDVCAAFNAQLPHPCQVTVMEDQNWNALWERDYAPVVVENQCLIRAHFHAARPEIPLEIIIEPRMSFGTAHHETTYMMISLLLSSDVKACRVLDMGSGTAVLAILAEKLGAREVWAIDNDEWAYQNAGDNLLKNNTSKTRVMLGDVSSIKNEAFELILANINRNILLQDIPFYRKSLNQGGLLYVSGFYEDDLGLISMEASKSKLGIIRSITRNRWVAAVFQAL